MTHVSNINQLQQLIEKEEFEEALSKIKEIKLVKKTLNKIRNKLIKVPADIFNSELSDMEIYIGGGSTKNFIELPGIINFGKSDSEYEEYHIVLQQMAKNLIYYAKKLDGSNVKS